MDKRTTKPILGEYRLSLRVQEAANALGISRAKAYQLIQSRDLPSVRIGNVVRVPKEGLEQWMARQAQD